MKKPAAADLEHGQGAINIIFGFLLPLYETLSDKQPPTALHLWSNYVRIKVNLFRRVRLRKGLDELCGRPYWRKFLYI